MNRTDRLNAILIQLQSKRVVKAREIADRFGISLRTVYRDIRALEEGGVPIGAEAGIGYFLQENYHLPPVMFTSEEASALLFGEKLIEKMSDRKIRDDFCSALYKVKAILKPAEKDYLEKLHDRVVVFNYSSMDDRFRQLYLNEIQQALVNKQVVRINYESRYAEEASWRLIEPIGLCHYSSRWHLFAWCRLREDYRDFRLDRIKELQLTGETFKGKAHLSISEYMAQNATITSDANITLLVPKNRIKFLNESKYWYGYLSEEDAGEHMRMFFSNNELHGFAAWVLYSGSHARVEQPAELKTIFSGYVHDIISAYRHELNEPEAVLQPRHLQQAYPSHGPSGKPSPSGP
jgi:predicted DNA-binding transcriptional regulator YafY